MESGTAGPGDQRPGHCRSTASSTRDRSSRAWAAPMTISRGYADEGSRTLQISRWSPRACATCGHSSSSRAERDRAAEQVMRWILGMALFRGASIHDLVSRGLTTLQHARRAACPIVPADHRMMLDSPPESQQDCQSYTFRDIYLQTTTQPPSRQPTTWRRTRTAMSESDDRTSS